MITLEQAKHIAEKIFGLTGSVERLSGESDFNFQIKTKDDNKFLLKISNEKKHFIQLQNAVLQWLEAHHQVFSFPILQPTLMGDYIGQLENNYFARLFLFIPGKLLGTLSFHSPILLNSLGNQLGHLTQALNHFQHKDAKRFSKWDLQQCSWIKDKLQIIDDAEDKDCIKYFLNRFESESIFILPRLRHSIIHGDMNDYNILVHDEHVSGFIDFGDVIETATICELAIALAYSMLNKSHPLICAQEIIKAYHAVFPLQTDEINILFDLICMRLCVSVVNSAIQKKEKSHDDYLTISEKPAWELLKKLKNIKPELATSIFHEACHHAATANTSDLHAARIKLIGKNVKLSYEHPLQIVRGQGQFLYDEKGRQYLDCINNVSHVGHCHPKVVAAGQQQMATLAINTRYLNENLTHYAERLLATLPPPLDVCFFVCTGSEANELALRLAETYTGREHVLVMDHGYYGNTSRLINISPYKFNGPGGKGKPDFVSILAMPTFQQSYVDLNLEKTLEKKSEKNLEKIFKINLEKNLEKNISAFICESLLSCGGQIILPPHYLQHVYSKVRKAGGLCIADEVQVGLGRVGTHFWGFETQDVVPDIVTMGKPLGNGYPLAAVVTTKKIAESFCNGMEYFNTFGGNPVACRIGLAVLDVIEEENLQTHALHVGNYLKQQLNFLMTKHACIKEVRGLGLFIGIEFQIFKNSNSDFNVKDFANKIINQMKERGVLLSTDGPLQNVIKIKPPLVFTKNDSDFLIKNLDDVLSSMN